MYRDVSARRSALIGHFLLRVPFARSGGGARSIEVLHAEAFVRENSGLAVIENDNLSSRSSVSLPFP